MSRQNVNTAAQSTQESSEKKTLQSWLVPASKRLSFIENFGESICDAQDFLPRWMKMHCKSYKGGYWEYYTASNGAGFFVPGYEGMKKISIAASNFQGEMTAEAAGITATLFMLNASLCKMYKNEKCQISLSGLIEKEALLKEYAGTLFERKEIIMATRF